MKYCIHCDCIMGDDHESDVCECCQEDRGESEGDIC